MRRPITPLQGKALAKLLLTLRPDWSMTYVEDAIAKMRAISDDVEDIIRVSTRGALSPAIRKPDVLAMTGEHWKARTEPDQPTVLHRELRCATCHRIHDPGSPCGNPPSQVRRLEPGELRRRVTAARKEPA